MSQINTEKGRHEFNVSLRELMSSLYKEHLEATGDPDESSLLTAYAIERLLNVGEDESYD